MLTLSLRSPLITSARASAAAGRVEEVTSEQRATRDFRSVSGKRWQEEAREASLVLVRAYWRFAVVS